MQEIGSFFNSVYANAQGDAQTIPWARLAPRPLFKQWADSTDLQGNGKKALQVACGLGDDAEELASRGFAVTAFDISPVAIEWCQQRFPASSVQYQVADLFALPESWQHSFDFVLESYTIQAIPRPMRPQAMSSIARTLAPGGTLLIICRGTDDINEISMPLPVMHEELAVFQQEGLQEVSFEDFPASDTLSARHFRVVYRA